MRAISLTQYNEQQTAISATNTEENYCFPVSF